MDFSFLFLNFTVLSFWGLNILDLSLRDFLFLDTFSPISPILCTFLVLLFMGTFGVDEVNKFLLFKLICLNFN